MIDRSNITIYYQTETEDPCLAESQILVVISGMSVEWL